MKRIGPFLLSLLLAAGAANAFTQAPFEFAQGKLLLAEGIVPEALDAFRRAIELEPDDPYLCLEYAEVLLRLALASPNPRGQQMQLRRAAEQADRARELAPDNVDVLRVVGRIYTALADRDPNALEVAVEALEGVRKAEPWDLRSMVTLGQIHLSRDEAARAAEVFDEAARYTPNNRMLFNFLADAHEQAGQQLEAEAALEQLVALDPVDLESRMRLAELQSRRDDHAAALATVEAAPDELRSEPRLRLLEARELFLTERPEEALALADEVLATEPGSRLLLFGKELRARILGRLGRDQEALDELITLVRLDPSNGDLVRRVAGELVREGRRQEAVAVLEDFLGRQPATGGREAMRPIEGVRLALAALYMEEEVWERGVEVLEPLLKSASPDSRDAGALQTAEILFRAGRGDEALALLDRDGGPGIAGKRVELLLRTGAEAKARRQLRELARSTEPAPALAAVQAFHGEERYRDSLPVLQELAEKHPTSVDILFLLGAAAERSDEFAAAAGAFQRLLELEPDHAPALNYLGYMWIDRGENLERALALVERAVELNPHNGAYVDSLGWGHFRLGNLDEARRHLERAVLLVPGDPVIYEHLGDVYLALGDAAKAAEQYRRALGAGVEAGGQDHDPASVRRKLDRLSLD